MRESAIVDEEEAREEDGSGELECSPGSHDVGAHQELLPAVNSCRKSLGSTCQHRNE